MESWWFDWFCWENLQTGNHGFYHSNIGTSCEFPHDPIWGTVNIAHHSTYDDLGMFLFMHVYQVQGLGSLMSLPLGDLGLTSPKQPYFLDMKNIPFLVGWGLFPNSWDINRNQPPPCVFGASRAIRWKRSDLPSFRGFEFATTWDSW